MKSFGLGKIFAIVLKVFLLGSLFIVVGLPLLAGNAVYFATVGISIGSQFFLRLLAHPLALGIVGAITIILIRRRMNKRKQIVEQVVE